MLRAPTTICTRSSAAGISARHHQPSLACAPCQTRLSAVASAAPAAAFTPYGQLLDSHAAMSTLPTVLGQLQRWAATEADEEQHSQHVSVMDTLCMLSYDEEQDEELEAVVAAAQRKEDFINAMDTLCLLSYDEG